MAFKMKGFSAFTNKKDPKATKKRILSSTQAPESDFVSEYSERDDKGTIVYRKGLKKYTKELDLDFNPTGKFTQLTRKDKKKLKMEGSYVSGRKREKIDEDFKSGKYAKDTMGKSKKASKYAKKVKKKLKKKKNKKESIYGSKGGYGR